MLNDAYDLIFNDALAALAPGQRLNVSEWSTGRRSRVMNYFRKSFPQLFGKQGRDVVFIGSVTDINNLAANKQQILMGMGIEGSRPAKPSPAYAQHQAPPAYSFNPAPDEEGVERVIPGSNRMPYKEQLDDLESLINLTVRGASNACFVAGRGGVGKSHVVEQTLLHLGMTDGLGYFKNSGSSSASGLYKMMFKHKDDILLFDDSDGSLADVDSRNLFKAATDTKKVRKLAWTKSSKNLMDPDDITDEDIEAGFLPSHFEFTGKVIFISNLSINRLDPDGALRTRALMINIDPSDEEVLKMMEEICLTMPLDDDKDLTAEERLEVVDVLRASKNSMNINLRKLVRGLNLRAADPTGSWKRMITMYA